MAQAATLILPTSGIFMNADLAAQAVLGLRAIDDEEQDLAARPGGIGTGDTTSKGSAAKGLVKIARRFNAGIDARFARVPQGRLNGFTGRTRRTISLELIQPSLRDGLLSGMATRR